MRWALEAVRENVWSRSGLWSVRDSESATYLVSSCLLELEVVMIM